MKQMPLLMLVLLLFVSLAAGCTKNVKEDEGAASNASPLYTSYNMWYEKHDNLLSTNYKKGAMIPAGTKISVVSLSRGKEIRFRMADDKSVKYTIHFVANHHLGMSIEEFKDRLFMPQPLSELTKGFTEQELECVKYGRIEPGISKKAVLVAYGYPPEHQSSIKGNRWIYWTSRFNSMVVLFNDKGLVEFEGKN